jgi:hypothetical protein
VPVPYRTVIFRSPRTSSSYHYPERPSPQLWIFPEDRKSVSLLEGIWVFLQFSGVQTRMHSAPKSFHLCCWPDPLSLGLSPCQYPEPRTPGHSRSHSHATMEFTRCTHLPHLIACVRGVSCGRPPIIWPRKVSRHCHGPAFLSPRNGTSRPPKTCLYSNEEDLYE